MTALAALAIPKVVTSAPIGCANSKVHTAERKKRMRIEKAFEHINRYSWLKSYFEQNIHHNPKDEGWLVNLLRNQTKYITPRPFDDLDLSSNPSCRYSIPIPAAEVGVKKKVDRMAFCLTSSLSFQLSKDGGKQEVEEASIATQDKLDYSVAVMFCYRFYSRHRKDEFMFEYLPSTHSIADGITAVCKKHGHTHRVEGFDCDFETLIPEGIIVTTMLHSHNLFTIAYMFELYEAKHSERGGNYRMDRFCKVKHR